MTRTSPGTWVFGSAAIVLMLLVLLMLARIGANVSDSVDRSNANRRRIEVLEIKPDIRPAKLSIEWPHARLDAETGPGEQRPAFNAEVMSMYQAWNKELR